MIAFDFTAFCDKRGIEYITKGVNVKSSDQANVNCPFCRDEGNPDPSFHLGIHSEKGYFSCWRNRRHRGKTLHRLLMKLVNISYTEACDILGEKDSWIPEGAFDELAANPEGIFSDTSIEQASATLAWPEEFNEFKGFRSTRRFINYLESRGYHPSHIQELIGRYNFHYAISGRWQERLVLPIYLDYRLVSWTTRSIQKNASLRYLSLSQDHGALMSIKDTVFNFDELIDTGGDVLFVTEGPFDAMKVDFYGASMGLRATCLFSKALREPQAILISELAQEYKKIVVLLDREEVDTTLLTVSKLSFLPRPVEVGSLPFNVKDPGELTPSGVYELGRYNYT